MTVLLLIGVAVTEVKVGTTLAGAVIVKEYVRVPSETPLAFSVSSETDAVPLVAEGIALSQVSGIV